MSDPKRRWPRRKWRWLGYLWASPNTLLGLLLGLTAFVAGGGVQLRAGVIEFYGGWLRWLLQRLAGDAAAMTLGHVILGQTSENLDLARQHELVHVRQYERWGPAFIPAYLACSFWLWLRRRRPYWDNPFEIEAFRPSS